MPGEFTWVFSPTQCPVFSPSSRTIFHTIPDSEADGQQVFAIPASDETLAFMTQLNNKASGSGNWHVYRGMPTFMIPGISMEEYKSIPVGKIPKTKSTALDKSRATKGPPFSKAIFKRFGDTSKGDGSDVFKSIRCPWHTDIRPSANIRVSSPNNYYIRCWSCKKATVASEGFKMAKITGVSLKDLFDKN
jgi:hypothetical protein